MAAEPRPGKFFPRPLCLIADRALPDRIDRLRAVLEAVGDHVMVIDRGDAPDAERLADLTLIAEVCRRNGGLLLVSRRADLALAVGAAGVHLPERGVPSQLVRGWPLIVGRSCHDRAGIDAAEADYVLLSPVAAPLSKPLREPPLGVDGFAALIAGVATPVIALGGIVPSLVGALRVAGAAGVASLGGVLGADEPAREARALLAAWESGAS